jgi:uncharacterized protein YigA (DUF484 family)
MQEKSLLQELADENYRIKNQIKDLEDTMWALDSQHKEYFTIQSKTIQDYKSQVVYINIFIVVYTIIISVIFYKLY